MPKHQSEKLENKRNFSSIFVKQWKFFSLVLFVSFLSIIFVKKKNKGCQTH